MEGELHYSFIKTLSVLLKALCTAEAGWYQGAFTRKPSNVNQQIFGRDEGILRSADPNVITSAWMGKVGLCCARQLC